MLLKELIEKKRTCFHQRFDTWQQAIQASCQLLVEEGVIEPIYVDSIIEGVEKNGPYIVFAPNVAMPHAQKRGDGVNGTAISFMKVNEPVIFDPNNRDKDAKLFFTVCATDDSLHLENMEKLAQLLMKSQEIVDELLRADSDEDLMKIHKKYFS